MQRGFSSSKPSSFSPMSAAPIVDGRQEDESIGTLEGEVIPVKRENTLSGKQRGSVAASREDLCKNMG